MNILFVNSTNQWAGIKTWMAHLGLFLHQRSHNVRFICRNADALVNFCQQQSIPCTSLRFGADYNPFTVSRLISIMKRDKTDLLVTNISKDIRTAGVAARILGIAHINRLGLPTDLKNSFRQTWEYRHWVDEVIVPSTSLAKAFLLRDELCGKVINFPNVVKEVVDQPSNNEIPQLAIVAQLSRRKQVHLVINALSQLRHLPWHLHIGGFGPEEQALKSQVEDLDLNSKISFYGFVDPYFFLRDKDVGILYSTSEGMPNAVLEYMASGCAVVASDLPSLQEVIQHNENGMLVDPNDTENFQETLTLLLTNRAKRICLSKKALSKVREDHCLPIIFKQIEKNFSELIEAKTSRYQLQLA